MLPSHRKLRGYAFDPSLSSQLDTYYINEVVYEVPWEDLDVSKGSLIGEYLEIIDYDPTTDEFIQIVDLNDTGILSQQGLDPSESNPQFHQQMVYAVAMTTIKNFEKALGRKVLWSSRRLNKDLEDEGHKYEEYVDKLRIYPHSLREPNAYYSPQKKALLFGYFHSNPIDQSDQMPGSLIFTCLSHDIIAHEVTHAILDGMKRHYNEPTNPDVLAFHEAFADIVALFQHFTFPEVLRHQISATKGDLATQNLLGELAQEFGISIGSYGSLRSAIGEINPNTKEWEPKEPDPREYHQTLEPHARGSILLGAVFEAFLAIYNRRVSDLYRIASIDKSMSSTDLHPDLVNRLSDEAAKVSGQILNMCIRAIDYCPPTDITFGEYLRAIVTADYDLVKEDKYGYRLAFIEAFKKRGIYPENVQSLSIESLRYPEMDVNIRNAGLVSIIADFLRDYSNKIAYTVDRKDIYDITKAVIAGGNVNDEMRKKMGMGESSFISGLHRRLQVKFVDNNEFVQITGLVFNGSWQQYGIRTSRNRPSFQVQNLRLLSRVGPENNKTNQVVFSIIQRCGVIMDGSTYKGYFSPSSDDEVPEAYRDNGYIFKAGATLIFDLDTKELKYTIAKKVLIWEGETQQFILNKEMIEKQWDYMLESYGNYINEFQQYFGIGFGVQPMEPFSLLHQQT
ncbi:hypothetical protein [Ekhidna sp.]|uniref:hypothetical protein n=1 Tax=Ekhidna sp. TaxID=2608089 RepID=UPI003B50A1F7